MDEIIRGTTPTIIFKFQNVVVENITVAYLIVKQPFQAVIEKPLEDAVVEENTLSWTLSQEETLKLMAGRDCLILCDWKLADGTRGNSKTAVYSVVNGGKKEVI